MKSIKIDWNEIEKNIAPTKWQKIEQGIWLVGRTYHIQYSKNGRSFKESTGIKFINSKQTNIANVRKILSLRKASCVNGKFAGLHVEKTTFDELAGDFLRVQKANNKSWYRSARSMRNLESFFTGFKAINITSDDIDDYIEERQKLLLSNAYINRDLAALRRMFRLGLKRTPPKVLSVPYINFLPENNIRKGFFTPEMYLNMKDALPGYFYLYSLPGIFWETG